MVSENDTPRPRQDGPAALGARRADELGGSASSKASSKHSE